MAAMSRSCPHSRPQKKYWRGENTTAVFLTSNGPGDPAAVTYAIESAGQTCGKRPIFGICLGHQILGLALGGKTYKLKFGHRGANHPVKNLETKQIEITSQNHGFCVDINSLKDKGVELTHINLNDNTLEGFRCKRLSAFCVQYHGCDVQVVPAFTSAKEVLAKKPDGVFLSNGPGDPAAVTYAVESTRQLLGKVPIFGICLGHQILGLALGGKTYKLKFGHRGANHPVKNLETKQIEITSQNHGFCVDINSLKDKGVELTHINLNDNTLEGFRCKRLSAFCVQYHPEASPGPHDSQYLFRMFTDLMSHSSRRRQG